MQTGALSVADREALGAKVLRQLDMEHYKECLKRSYLDGPGASILHAQTSIEGAELGTTGPWTEDGSRPPPDPSHRSMRWTMRWPLTMRRWSPSTKRWRASCRPATRGNLPPSCTRSFQRHQWRNWSSMGRWWDQPTRPSSLHSSHGCAITTSENFASLVEFGGWPMDGSTHPSGPSSWNGRSW